jgi:hypothetical protein
MNIISSNNKHKRQIRKLVKLLLNKYDVSSIYVEDIADCLEYPQDLVENELHLLYKEGILKPAWELHCDQCGSVAAFYELPQLFQKGPMVPCASCLSLLETEGLSIDDLVRTYQFVES